LRSVNHRFLDLQFRMPRQMTFCEDMLRKRLSALIPRGHVDVYASLREVTAVVPEVKLNTGLLKAVSMQAQEAGRELDNVDANLRIADLLGLPQVISIENQAADEEELACAAAAAMDEAADRLLEMRMAEGIALESAMRGQLASLEEIRRQIAMLAPQMAVLARQRITERLGALLQEALPPERLAAEVAVIADKAAVDEELVRLRAHIESMERLMGTDGEGKKMDFLIQELHREVNTVGSKSISLELTQLVLEAKALVEKLREQIQNIA